MSKVRQMSVSDADADIRLDRWFRRHFPGLKHGRLEKLLRTGQIRVDGGRAKGSTRLAVGQTVRIPPLGEEASAATPKRQEFSAADDIDWIWSLVIHRDEDVIALNKPPGIAVQGGRKVSRHIDGLLGGLAGEGEERPRLVHRLDRDTSGVLLVARRARSAAALAETFRSREARKTYWALVNGVPSPERGTIDAAILKQAGRDGYEKMTEDALQGQEAVTDYEVIERAGRKVAWLGLQPHTGRTHQLRIHCAGLGTPILGDRKYGAGVPRPDGIPGAGKLLLHARSIDLPHPNGGRLQVTAKMPNDMADTFRFFGFEPPDGA